VGSATARQLAQMGVYLTLYDGDVVSEHNCGTQGYPVSFIGLYKAEAMSQICKAYNDKILLASYDVFFNPATHHINTPITVLVPDNIDTRKSIYHNDSQVDLLIDGRMAAEFGQVYCVDMHNPAVREKYERSFFPQNEALQETCTSRATIYCGEFIASLISSLYKAYCMRALIPWKVSFNLKSLTLLCEYPNSEEGPNAT